MLKEWRDNYYFGASGTTRHLLNHWFGRAHLAGTNGRSQEHNIVRLVLAVPSERLEAGAKGTVVHIYRDRRAYNFRRDDLQ